MNVEKLFAAPGARLNARAWTKGLTPSRRVALVSEAGAWRRFGPGVEKALKRAGLKVHRHLLPSGEVAIELPVLLAAAL